jgi:hypothetical protein
VTGWRIAKSVVVHIVATAGLSSLGQLRHTATG